MAEFLGVSTGTIGNWETKASMPGFEELDRIALKLNEPAAYLLGFAESFMGPGAEAPALKDAPASNPWRHLSEETLRAAISDLSRAGTDDEALAHLEFVVGEVRERARRQKGPSGGAIVPKSPKVAAALADLASVRPGKPTT